MAIQYQEGRFYDLKFIDTKVQNGVQYIVVTDDINNFTIKPYDYQTEYSCFPHMISCYVKRLCFDGSPQFEQSKEFILKNRYYQVGESHNFCIDDIRIDSNSGKTVFILSDEYGITHRYYPKGTNKKIGEYITLIVKGIVPAQEGKNNARLDLIDKMQIVSAIRPQYPRFTNKKNFGTEDSKKEFKSSIAYPAGETTADIDKQLDIICRTIAGFMNANGGTLYIGVSDNGYICGIESDYCHLNDGEDEFTYKENDDQYMLKITNRICAVLGRIAGTLINMRIEEADDHKYCVVDIQKASRPIWFYGTKLFVRITTTNRMLKNDEITQFILDRISKNSFSKLREEEKPVEENFSSETTKPVIPYIAQKAPITTKNKIWRYITFYKNGEWSFQKDALQGDDIVCSTEIPCDARQNNLILILAYKNGHIEATYLKEALYGKNGLLPEGKRRGNGLCLENGEVVSTFCAKKRDMLLLTSEVSGKKYVKALDVDTLGIHDRMGKGNEIIREKGASLTKITKINEDIGSRIALMGSGIFIEKNQKYTKGGVQFSLLSPTYREMLEKLDI